MANGKKNGKKHTRKQTRVIGRPFEKGNKFGNRWAPGQTGNPRGRPPNLGSPRAQLKRYAEEIAPQKFRDAVKKAYPEIDCSELTWAELVAIAHLENAAEGRLSFIEAAYKQLDDSGVFKIEGQLSHAIHGDINARLAAYGAVLGDLATGSSGVATTKDAPREPVDPEGADGASG